MEILEKGFLYLEIASAILLPYSIVLFILRKKRLAIIKLRAETNPKIINNLKQLVTSFRFILWLSPFYLIFAPWAISKFMVINGIIVFICMALMFTNVLVQYLHTNWLYEHISKPDRT